MEAVESLPMGEGIWKVWCSHTCGIYDNMDGPGDYYAKQNKSARERQIPYDFTHMWNLIKKKEPK